METTLVKGKWRKLPTKADAPKLRIVGAAEQTEDRSKQVEHSRQTVLVAGVMTEAGKAYGLTVEDLIGRRKTIPISEARSIAMYLIRLGTTLSLPAIGRLFVRDHTTVLLACRRVQVRLDMPQNRKRCYLRTRLKFEQIREALGGRWRVLQRDARGRCDARICD